MNALDYLLRCLGCYLAIQVVILIILNLLTKPQLINQVRRSVYISSVNHIFFLIAGVLGAMTKPEAAKINLIGVWWIFPLGLVLGFVSFIITEVASRLAKRYLSDTLLDLQLFAVTPVVPRNILIPGLVNYLVLKPLGEELFLRAFVIGVLSTQIHVAYAILITILLENLRYPQAAWFPRNTLRVLFLSVLFIYAPTVLLPLSASIVHSILASLNQISRIKNALEKTVIESTNKGTIEPIDTTKN